MRDDWALFHTLRLHLAGERWQFLNPDVKTKLPGSRQGITEVLKKYGRSLSVGEVNRYLSLPPDRYPATKQLMYRMLRDRQLVRSSRGRYVIAN